MGRSTTTGLDLTWKPYGKRKGRKVKGGQWVKKIDGLQMSFGTGTAKSDQKAYTAARDKYLRYVEEQREDHRFQQLARAAWRAEYKQRGIVLSEEGRLLTHDDIANLSGIDTPEFDDINTAGPDLEEVLALVERSRRQSALLEKARHVQVEEDEHSFASIMDLYLEARQKDVTRTRAMPDAVAHGKQLSAPGYRSIENHLATFREFAGSKAVSDIRGVEDILVAYRDMLSDRIVSNQYTAHTVNTKLAKLRTYIKWAVARHYLESMPANMQEVTASFAVRKSGKPLTKEIILDLWAAANERMKAWMAVALNTGAYPSDVARLSAEHLRDGRIIRPRTKTHAQSNHKLWPITQGLIERTRQDLTLSTGGLLWITEYGNALVDHEAQRDTLGQLFAKLCRKVGVRATWSQLRDTSAEEVEAISRRAGTVDPALVSLFLSHRDHRTATYYLSDNPVDMETGTLDKALDQLEKFYGLEA